MKHLAIAVALMAACAAWSAADETKPQDEIRALERQVAALGVLHRLGVTDDQARVLYDLARAAAQLEAGYRERLCTVCADQVIAFTVFRKEDIANVGFTPVVERMTHETNERGKALTKEFFGAITRLEAQASLDEAQRRQLERLRAKDLAAFLAPRDGRNGDRESSELTETREELEEIHKAEHGSLGPVGRLLVFPGILEALAARIGQTIAAPAVERDRAGTEAVRALRDDINLLNLINGMNFSAEQLDGLAQQARLAADQRTRTAPESGLDPALAESYRNALTKALTALRAGQDPDRDDLRRAFKRRKQAGLPGKERGRGGAEPGPEAVAAVRTILTECQREVLLGYQPCLIPPKNLKDPVRVGQASDNGKGEKVLTRLREIPAADWERNRDEVVARAFARIEAAGGAYAAGERESRMRELTELLEQVRAMDDLDFELGKAEVAQQFSRFNRKQALEEELKSLAGDDAVIDRKVRSILLHPAAAPLYAARAKQLREAKPGRPADLERIDAAEHCEDGKCAIEDDRESRK